METKQNIRKQVFQLREAADPSEVALASKVICQKVTELPSFKTAEWIYTYIDFNNEVMTREIVEKAWQNGKRVAAPKVEGRELVFYEITSYQQLMPGYFGVPEPEDCSAANREDALIIVPGVAFDPDRHRIGYGQGFYDRYLSRHTLHPTVAVAFDFQVMKEVPSDPQDVLPDMLITQSHIYK